MKTLTLGNARLAAFMAIAGALSVSAPRAIASSHREAPLISQDPTVDNTDLYAWRDMANPAMVNLVACFDPFEDPAGGPNFFRFSDDALYEIKIDNNGDALPDISFQFRFHTSIGNGETFLYNTGPITSLNDPDFNLRQTYDLSVM